MLITTTEAQALLDGCLAWCDRRACEDKATMVIEYGPMDCRTRTARCASDGEANTGIMRFTDDEPIERVALPVMVR